ncbi:MAG: efflux RND transporter periplasmic adaptor subunit [Thermoanaerobaculia bacterium]
MRLRSLVLVATSIGALGAAGCGRAPAAAPPSPVTVSVAAAARADLPDFLDLQGRLVPPAEEDVLLAPQVAGLLVRVPVREGDAVRRGALLAEVDPAPLDEGAAAAAAALAKAHEDEAVRVRALALTERLLARGITSAEERDADRAALASARAARVESEGRASNAARQRRWASVRAPFDGIVAQVLKRPGEVVDGTPSTAVIRLLGTAAVEVAADAEAADLSRVKPGAAAETVLPGSSVPVSGRVTRVARSVDPATGIGEVRVRLFSRSRVPLLASVPLRIVLAVHRGTVVVPREALRRTEAGTEEVVVASNGVAAVRVVSCGVRTTTHVEIVRGLSAGETIVVDSPLGLVAGQPLAVRPDAAR